MNKFFLIRDKYIKYKDEIINVIENIDSNGIVIKDFRNTVKNVNIDNMLLNEEIIFVDVTADWCATCQFNKINTLDFLPKKIFFLTSCILRKSQ